MVNIKDTIIHWYNNTYIAGHGICNTEFIFNKLEEKEIGTEVNLEQEDYGKGLISRDLNKW